MGLILSQMTRLAVDKANWVVNDVYSLAFGESKDLFLPTGLRIVDSIVCASVFFGNLQLLSRSSGSNDISTKSYVGSVRRDKQRVP